MQGKIIPRTRTNQPKGYFSATFSSPVSHYCVNHNYLYYPSDWTDETSGREYKRGYYDEDGQYYEDVAFRKDGKYRDILCRCEYCDTVTKLDWTEGGPLICPQCGGSMKIISALDEYTRDPNYDSVRQRNDYVDYADRDRVSAEDGGGDDESDEEVIGKIGAVFFGLFLFLALIVGVGSISDSNTTTSSRSYVQLEYLRWDSANNRWLRVDEHGTVIATYSSVNNGGENESESEPLTNPEIFGEVIRLKEKAPGVFVITADYDCDRELYWIDADENYYDTDSELWAWYNTEVDPPLWQYWYEPISGDFGDCGWMEYEDGVWFIEASPGDWIEVPEAYDLSPLWHIEGDPAPAEEDDTPEELGRQTDPEEELNDLAIFGAQIHLTERVPGIWRITADGEKTLRWDDSEQSYYDEDSGLWAWYNTDVEPPLWQYWYEPISGNYEGCGWMEYENEAWYIETNHGWWIEVPEQYDTSPLWHIETDD